MSGLNLLKPSEVPISRFLQRGKIKDGLMPLTALVIGLLMTLSGNKRWRDESLSLAMDLPFQPQAGGLTIILFAVILFFGIERDSAIATFAASWALTLMFAAMAMFSFAAYMKSLHSVDNLVWALWAYLSIDFMVKAQSHWGPK